MEGPNGKSIFIRVRSRFRDWSVEPRCGAHWRQAAGPEGPVAGWPGARCVAQTRRIDQWPASRWVLDLQPRGRHAVAVVWTVFPFGDHALEIGTADGLKQFDCSPLNGVEIQEPRLNAGNQGLQSALAFQQWDDC